MFSRTLDYIEIVGNRLSHPATLFPAGGPCLASWIGDATALQATHPVDKSTITVRGLLDWNGVRWIYQNVVRNSIDFPPLGLVLVRMIGIGVAEGSGLFTLMIRALVATAPKQLITASIVAAAIPVAPVPMFMLLGHYPALTQAAFRIGNSVTNVITPMMSYFALILAFAQKYDEKYGIGTIISVMVPYTVLFVIV